MLEAMHGFHDAAREGKHYAMQSVCERPAPLPMDLPGIEVRPLKTVLGSSEFAEVFLTDVRVPVANRVGDENDGWRVAMVSIAFCSTSRCCPTRRSR